MSTCTAEVVGLARHAPNARERRSRVPRGRGRGERGARRCPATATSRSGDGGRQQRVAHAAPHHPCGALERGKRGAEGVQGVPAHPSSPADARSDRARHLVVDGAVPGADLRRGDALGPLAADQDHLLADALRALGAEVDGELVHRDRPDHRDAAPASNT